VGPFSMMVISTVIPVWNRVERLKRAIDSALAQELPAADWCQEVIVVDDGSAIDVAGALKAYDDRVAVIPHGRNFGAGQARNTGVAAAKGQFVAFLDSDDVWLPGKLTAQLGFMKENDVQASCSSYLLVRDDGSTIVSPRRQKLRLGFSDLVWGCFVSPGSTLVFARPIFDEIGPLDVSMRRLEDWEWLLRLTQSHELGFLAQPLARIQASGQAKPIDVHAALARIEERWAEEMSASDRRHFKAALALERAVVNGHNGRVTAAALSLLHSLWLAPVGNLALASVLHNRTARQ
jgi:glycosyltransferase involved in cell wall biosynthesis